MTQIEVIQTEAGVFYDDPDTGERIAVQCQWFAKCDRAAATTRQHPVLGDVPLCAKCDAWCDRMSE